MSNFSTRLKELRMSKKMSQSNLADCLGFTKSRINMYERGEREPKFEILEIIADFFNVDMEYLIGKTDIPNRALCNTATDITESLTDEEKQLMHKFRTLNSSGKEKAAEYITDLSENPKYTALNDNSISSDIINTISHLTALNQKTPAPIK